MRSAASPLQDAIPLPVLKWERKLGVTVSAYHLSPYEDKVRKLQSSVGQLRWNTELVKKPRDLLEYVVAHEMAHLMEPSQGERLADLVMRCLAKDTAARPQSAEDILAVLDTINTATDRAGTRGGNPSPRNARRSVLIAATVITLACIAGAFAWRSWRGDGNTIRSLVVAPFENVGGDSAVAYLSHGVTDELTVALGRIPGLRVAPRVASSASPLAPADLARAMDVQGVLSGSVRRARCTHSPCITLNDRRRTAALQMKQPSAGYKGYCDGDEGGVDALISNEGCALRCS